MGCWLAGIATVTRPVPLRMADVGKADVLYDLGSGDGRIPITAARKHGVKRAVGIDINPDRIQEAEANRRKAGVGNRVRFVNADLFETSIEDATVVTLYLLPSLNLKLLPKMLAELKPGTRIADSGGTASDDTTAVDTTGRGPLP